ncbi:DUF3995 domain-containing protein [Cohnella silvisoli]|uniref:DUF3995 domain-containing protein n=1 Tax=Cohnella silvisoli TaxID=2873699 RepID=A0ABV1KQF8_9BACL|nr:DUF3995 domain-containing protein [Cohnella silvisoli]MCD9022002.1 DUF3995 domain-containing protein [Cohnella silvisoli]
MNKLKSWPIICGVIWSLLFAFMSFYWASGGMLGVDTLGGEIYRQAVLRNEGFILIVWLTGIAKVLGALLLLSLFIHWKKKLIIRAIYFITLIVGIFLLIYGLINFVTIFLSLIHILNLSIDNRSAWWRLLFWEPFWMLGGVFYMISGRLLIRGKASANGHE